MNAIQKKILKNEMLKTTLETDIEESTEIYAAYPNIDPIALSNVIINFTHCIH